MPSSIQIKTINHVGIPVWDRRVSLKFYREVLGLQVIPSMVDSPNIVWTRTLDGTMVHLIEPPDGETLGGSHTAFEVQDFDSAVADIKASAYHVITASLFSILLSLLSVSRLQTLYDLFSLPAVNVLVLKNLSLIHI